MRIYKLGHTKKFGNYDSLWENIRFYNWTCNWVFHLQQTFATHGIYTALSAYGQVATIATNTLCCIQFCIYGATHMQLYATSLQ